MKETKLSQFLFPFLIALELLGVFILINNLNTLSNSGVFNLQLTPVSNAIKFLQVFSIISVVFVVIDLIIHRKDIPLYKPLFLVGSGSVMWVSLSMNKIVELIADIQSINLYSATKDLYSLYNYNFSLEETLLMAGTLLILISLIFWIINLFKSH